MSSYEDRADEYMNSGYSCSQAVLLACAPEFGLSKETAAKLGSGLGGGFAGLRETCGALIGMAMVIGLRDGEATPLEGPAKSAHYARIQKAIRAFEAANGGTHTCMELLKVASARKKADLETDPAAKDYYAKKRPCTAFVRLCAKLAMEA